MIFFPDLFIPPVSPPCSSQGFVLAVTVIREAAEEIRCYMRDKEVNSQIYSKLTARGRLRGSGIQPC